jgi:glycosyltransferase involved in cell wall biosynthesis
VDDGLAVPEPEVVAPRGRRLRILHIYRRFHPDYTGDGIYYMKLIPMIARLGIESEVLVLETRPPSLQETCAHDGLRIHYLSSRAANRGIGSVLIWLARRIWTFDVLHVHSHTDRWFLAYILARLCGRRVIFSCSLDDSPTQLLASYQTRYRRVAAFLSHSINTFVVISPHLLRLSLESTAERRLRFIPQGVMVNAMPPLPERRLAARRKLGLDPTGLLLLNVGSIIRRKNVLFLVQALAALPDPAIKLVIVGPALEDDYQREVGDFIATNGLTDRVILTGFQDSPDLFYAACDAFVFSSLSEGFGNVFLEAMSWSLPIVTLFLPGIVDFIIDHGRTGFLARDLEQFVEGIQTLRLDAELRTAMGLESRRFVERHFDMHAMARAYARLYGEARSAAPPIGASFPDFPVRFSNFMASGPDAIGLKPIVTPPAWPPVLQIVIDTESEFEWDKGTWTDQGQISSIGELPRACEMFQRHGLLPAVVIDFPIATQERSKEIIQILHREGCEIGVHPHIWSTPPAVEPRDDWHSFAGNLGPKLQLAKLSALTRQVESIIGQRPVMFKAGRYGISADTIEALEELGFLIDLSVCPHYDFSPIGGPDFSRFTSQPGWFGASHRLISLPTTAGWLGLLRSHGAVARLVNSGTGRRLRMDRIAARANLLYQRRLSPEGNSLEEMKQLTKLQYRNGLRVFTLSLHSPTLQAGNTPYTRTPQDVRDLLKSLDHYLTFFRDDLGGVFSTPMGLYERLAELAPQPAVTASARAMVR